MRQLPSLTLLASVLAGTVVLSVGVARVLASNDPSGDRIVGGGRSASYAAVASHHPSSSPLALKAPPTT